MEEHSTIQASPRGLKQEVVRALGAFSPLERLVFIATITIGAIAVILLLNRINQYFLVPVPIEGGTLREGVVGTPRFINPLLATSDADRDLTALVYRGLMKKDAKGAIVPDLAESYTVSNDGLTYTFTLRETKFHDGTPLTSSDVVFTVKSAQDATLKSAERVAWEGVLVKAPDEHTVTFTLKQPFAPFLANTTLGILPKHIWENIEYNVWAYSDYNGKHAIGDGAYKVDKVTENSSGIPQAYTLTAVRSKNDSSPLIDSIEVHFYASEEALVAAYTKKDIDTLGGIDPKSAEALRTEGAQILTAPLPRVFGLFFNQAQAKIFTSKNVRTAIDLALDKEAVVAQVLYGYGTVEDGPIPSGTSMTEEGAATRANGAQTAEAKKLLEKDGWKLGEDGIYEKVVAKKQTDRLSFEIATNDTPELKQAVDLIVKDLRAAGIEAIEKVYETGSLNQDIIRPRKFQALFFGEVVTNQSDLYAFWHSSQRTDPGLNISSYANSKADKLLEQGLTTLDPAKESTVYSAFEKEISSDMPAVFVYSPSYIYVTRAHLPEISLGNIDTPEDRFNGLSSWYLATDRVWKIFAKK
jgi:peptide/nickel transport system substrate-binding protein